MIKQTNFFALLPPPGNLPDQVIEPRSLLSPALAGMFFTTSATREAFLFNLFLLVGG